MNAPIASDSQRRSSQVQRVDALVTFAASMRSPFRSGIDDQIILDFWGPAQRQWEAVAKEQEEQ